MRFAKYRANPTLLPDDDKVENSGLWASTFKPHPNILIFCAAMGNTLNNPKLTLLRETEQFARWTVSDLRALLANFVKTTAGFSLIRAQFVAVLEETKPELSGQCDRLFTRLDNDGDGRIDGLEFMGGLALIARGSFEDKTKVSRGVSTQCCP